MRLITCGFLTVICIRSVHMEATGEVLPSTDISQEPDYIESFFIHNQTLLCNFCPSNPIFTDLEAGEQHLETVHRDKPNANRLFLLADEYECRICGKTYSCRNIVIGHLRRKHGVIQRAAPTKPSWLTLIKTVREVNRLGPFRTVYPTVPSPAQTTFPSAIFEYYDKVISKLIETRRKLVRVRVKRKKRKMIPLNNEDRAFFTWLDDFNQKDKS